MLKKYFLRFVAVVAVCAAAVSLSSCSDDDNTGPERNPAVKLTAGTATDTSVTFTIAPEDATQCAYMYVKKGEAVPAASEILSKGKAVAVDRVSPVELSGLDPVTTYTIAAVSASGQRAGQVATLDMTTLESPALLPEVALGAGKKTETTVTFTLTPKNATRAAYMCIAADAALPSAADILKDGEQADAAAADEYTVEDLRPATAYVIVAASSNGDTEFSEVASLPVSTLTIEFDEEVAATYGMGVYRDNYQYNGRGNYVVTLGNAPMEGGYVTGAGSIFYFDCYAPSLASDMSAAEFEPGVYRFDAGNSYEARTFSDKGSILQVFGESYLDDAEYGFKEGILDVSKSGSQYEIVAYITLENDRVVKCTYKGELPFETDVENNLTLIEKDENIRFDHVAAYYSGDYHGVGKGSFALAFGDQEIGDNGYLAAPGNQLFVELSTRLFDDVASAEVPAGTYTVSADYAEGTFAPFLVAHTPAMDLVNGTYLEKMSEGAGLFYDFSYGMVTGGTVTVSRSGDDYTFEFDFTTANGHAVKGSYTGPMPLKNDSKASSTLTEDYELDLSGVASGTLDYLGDAFGNGTGAWNLTLMTKAEGTDGLIVTLASETASAAGPDNGNYTIDESLGAMTCRPGRLEGTTIYPTSFVGGFNASGEASKFAPARAGSIYLMKSGDQYTVYFEFYDDADPSHSFYGDWTGPITITDKSTKALAAPYMPGAPVKAAAAPAKSAPAASRDRKLQTRDAQGAAKILRARSAK